MLQCWAKRLDSSNSVRQTCVSWIRVPIVSWTFAWIMDPDGNEVELWEPMVSNNKNRGPRQ
jgi:hypothetical protein